ncbi:GlyGly-CTERM sorting domain-containing protein [Shewanella marisflavi]|uniref:GlyGly-CTERM sorting domain-containing protein n=1 Tax=Shewanella marisflavi TaxID=260364 RepID=UPI003AAF4722
MNKSKLALAVVATLCALSSTATYAASFTKDANKTDIAQFNKKHGVVTERNYVLQADYMLQSGTAPTKDRPVTCLDFPWGKNINLGADEANLCSDDLSDTTIDVVYFYHPAWIEMMPSLGEAYKFARDSIELANEGMAENTNIKVKLVGFEAPDFTGYKEAVYDFYMALYGELPDQDEYNAIPSPLNFTHHAPTWYEEADGTGSRVKHVGLDDYMQNSTYFFDYAKKYGMEGSNFKVGALMNRLGADHYAFGRPREENIDPGESVLCGFGGGQGSFLMLDQDSKLGGSCPNVFTHEFGHGLKASHEEEYGVSNEWYSGRAYSCDQKATVMHSIASQSNHLFFSSPDTVRNGEVCGVDDKANNAWYVEKSGPLMANTREKMAINGSTWFASGSISADEDAGTVSFKVMRDGDLSEPTSVKVFIDGAVTDNLLRQDFINVAFPAGGNESTVTVSIVNNESTEDNRDLVAELVLPVEMSIGTQGKMSIALVNDDQEETPTTPTTPTPEPKPESSGGGSLGFISLLLLAAVGRLRKA